MTPPSERRIARRRSGDDRAHARARRLFRPDLPHLVVGKASDAQRRAFDVYREALEAGIAAVRPGATAGRRRARRERRLSQIRPRRLRHQQVDARARPRARAVLRFQAAPARGRRHAAGARHGADRAPQHLPSRGRLSRARRRGGGDARPAPRCCARPRASCSRWRHEANDAPRPDLPLHGRAARRGARRAHRSGCAPRWRGAARCAARLHQQYPRGRRLLAHRLRAVLVGGAAGGAARAPAGARGRAHLSGQELDRAHQPRRRGDPYAAHRARSRAHDRGGASRRRGRDRRSRRACPPASSTICAKAGRG